MGGSDSMRSITGALIAAGALTMAGSTGAATAPTVLHIDSHLPKAAKAWLDGGKPIVAPGEGGTVVPVSAGTHVLKVTTAAGVTYQTTLDLKPANLMKWRGRGYWCVNLLERSLEVYSTEDCEEDVTDAG
jgi:hypothetical protein